MSRYCRVTPTALGNDRAAAFAFNQHSMTFSAHCLLRPIRGPSRATRTSCLHRIRGNDGFADPDFGLCEVVAEARISLRYTQKLFTERNSTCRISSIRFAWTTPHAF